MLNPNYTVIGIARAFNANSKYGWYWTTDFGLTMNPGPPPPTLPGQTKTPTPTPSPTPQGGTPTPVSGSPIVNLPGCAAASLAFGDDAVSSPETPAGFTMNLFGTSYDKLFVNNNGNVTFGAPLIGVHAVRVTGDVDEDHRAVLCGRGYVGRRQGRRFVRTSDVRRQASVLRQLEERCVLRLIREQRLRQAQQLPAAAGPTFRRGHR